MSNDNNFHFDKSSFLSLLNRPLLNRPDWLLGKQFSKIFARTPPKTPFVVRFLHIYIVESLSRRTLLPRGGKEYRILAVVRLRERRAGPLGHL